MNHRAVTIVAFSGLAALAGVAVGQVTIFPDTFQSSIHSISDDGRRAVGGRTSPDGYYFWNASDGFVNLNRRIAPQSYLPLVSGDGMTMLAQSAATGSNGHAFLATATGGFTVIPYLAQQGVAGSVPSGISRDGSVVAGWDADSHGQSLGAWRWTDAGMQALPLRIVNAMSGDGNTILGDTFSAERGAIWHSGEVTQLLPLPGSEIQSIHLLATNDNGSIIVGSSGYQAAVWVNGQGHFLPPVAGFSGFEAKDVSEDGSVVIGETFAATGGPRVVVWTPAGGMEIAQYLGTFGYDLSPYTISEAHVSADGRTFGMTGRSTIDSSVRGIIVTIPSPATLCVLAGAFAVVRRRR